MKRKGSEPSQKYRVGMRDIIYEIQYCRTTRLVDKTNELTDR